MSQFFRLIWVTVLLVFLSGCTSYRYAVLPQSSGISSENSDNVVVVPKSNAKVTLITGETISGEVIRASEEELVLGRPGNYGVEEEIIQASNIATIEVEYSSTGQNVVIFSAIGVAALAIFAAKSFNISRVVPTFPVTP